MDVDDNGNVVVSKTGMGSSAALITSLVGGLLECFQVIRISNPKELRLAHNVAQLCHCAAQGKVSE